MLLRVVPGALGVGAGGVGIAADVEDALGGGALAGFLDDGEIGVSFEDDGFDVFEAGGAGVAQGGGEFVLRDALLFHGSLEHLAAEGEEGGFALDEAADEARADAEPGEDVLDGDEDEEAGGAFGESDALIEHGGGEGGAEGDGDDEVEGVHFGEGALAADAQEKDEGEVGEGADDGGASEVLPGGEEHAEGLSGGGGGTAGSLQALSLRFQLTAFEPSFSLYRLQ